MSRAAERPIRCGWRSPASWAVKGLASAEVKEALDLCVSCKGCRRDCPTGVDMAKFKIEARHAWTKRHGITLREHGGLHAALCAGRQPVSALLALADSIPGISGAIKRALGFAPSARCHASRHRSCRKPGPGGRQNRAAKSCSSWTPSPITWSRKTRWRRDAVLEAAGYTVHFNTREGERPLCCGRTFLAAGLVDQAREEARRLLDAVKPYVDRNIPIVGLEPSCLLSLRDEFLNYGYGDEARKLAAQAFLFEEFLVREKTAGRLALDLDALQASGSPGAWPLPPEGLRCLHPGADRARLDPRPEGVAGGILLLRHGGQLRLRGRAL
ncbi:hypothetical protein ACU4GD_21150 [Cupriavidus basilensis]